LGWKNWLGNDEIDGVKNNNYFRNFTQVFDVSHGNELSLRVIYFLDYNQFRKKENSS
jgi:hypothetical protein